MARMPVPVPVVVSRDRDDDGIVLRFRECLLEWADEPGLVVVVSRCGIDQVAAEDEQRRPR